MGLSASSGVKLPGGAARTIHCIYPQHGLSRTNGGNFGNGSTRRPGISDAGGISLATTATATHNVQGIRKGCIPGAITNAAAGDLGQVQLFGKFFPMMEQLNNDVPGDPNHVFRFLAILSCPLLAGPIGATADLGMEILPGNVASMNNGAVRPGVMFGLTDVGTIGLRIRKAFAGAFTLDRELTFAQAGVNDVTNWNLWELRIVSADSRGPALLKAFINGRQFGASVDCSAAAGIMFALDAAGGGFNGYQWGLMNSNMGVYNTFYNDLHVIQSPAEDDAG